MRVRACEITIIFYKIFNILKQKYYLDNEIHYFKSKIEELLRISSNGYKIKLESLGLNKKNIELIKKHKSNGVIIAKIDQDGFLLSNFGPIKNAPNIGKNQFIERKRFNLNLVLINGYICIEKDYRGNKLRFINELKAFSKLDLEKCNVPSLMNIDFDKPSLTYSYILGSVLREELAQKGAILRDRDIKNNPAFKYLNPKEKKIMYANEGKKVLYDVIDTKFIEQLFTELNKIHNAGIILNDIKYGNIVIEKRTNIPYLIDFDSTYHYPKLGKKAFNILQDRDIEKFNLLFDTHKLTYQRIKKRISSFKTQKWYAPVYFSAGLRIGSIWNINVGYGRWHYILKQNLPSLSGKRILDLGANNGVISLQMLRNGANEVIGIELNSNYIAQGNFVKEAYEWADNTRYNFKYIKGNMKELPQMNLGKFDIVIALCSLYYLPDDSISNLIRYISKITDVIVLQCNIDTKRKNSNTYKKASLEYTQKILKLNGFPNIRIIAPPKYSRPLVIGEKNKN